MEKRLVKKEVKKDFYLYILSQIQSLKAIKHIYQNRQNKISKQRLNYHIQKLKQKNLIYKISNGVWDLTLEGRQLVKKLSMGMRKHSKKKTNIHALNIEVPITSRNKGFKADKITNLRNWVAEYKYGLKPLGLTLKLTTKTVQIYVYSREIKDHSEVTGLLVRVLAYVKKYLGERGVKIDIFEAKVKTLHLAIKDKDLEKIIPENLSVEVEFERVSKRLLKEKKERKARAWTDTSPFRGVETNDVEYAENYLRMPERINRIENNLEKFSDSLFLYDKNIKKHLSVLDQMSKTLKKIEERFK